MDKKFFKRAGRHFEKLLAGTASSLTLHIEELHESHVLSLNRLLDQLAQQGGVRGFGQQYLGYSEPNQKSK